WLKLIERCLISAPGASPAPPCCWCSTDQLDRCHTRAAASAPNPLTDQCSAIGAIRLPLRLRSQLKTNPAAAVAITANVTPASMPMAPPPSSRVNPTLLLVNPNDVAMCQRPNSSEPATATPRNPHARFNAPCSTPRKASSSGITVCNGMMSIEAISAPEIVAYRLFMNIGRVCGSNTPTAITVTTSAVAPSAYAAPDFQSSRPRPSSAQPRPLNRNN